MMAATFGITNDGKRARNFSGRDIPWPKAVGFFLSEAPKSTGRKALLDRSTHSRKLNSADRKA
jgi:hypothetical protein